MIDPNYRRNAPVTVEYFEYPLYSELRVTGSIRVQDWVGTSDVPPPINARLLIDYGAVDGIDVSVGQLIAAAEALAEADVRFAFIGPADAPALALLLRALLLARADDGVDYVVLPDREQALAWLLAGLEPS